MAEPTKVVCEACQHCGVIQVAELWCNDCDEGFCDECIKNHQTFKILRNHSIISLTDHLKISDISVCQTCTEHNKKLESFCQQHDQLLCLKCIQSNHSKCDNIIGIVDAAKGSKNSAAIFDLDEDIKNLLKNIEQGIVCCYDNGTVINDEEHKIKERINKTREEIDKTLDQLQEMLLSELTAKTENEREKLDKCTAELTKKEKKVKEIREQSSKIKEFASETQVFVVMKNMQHTVNKEKDIMKLKLSSIPKDLPYLKINSELLSWTQNLKTFGEIHIETQSNPLPFIETKVHQAQLSIK
ncbi:Hypothetical predicted protein [Mytilus galloprovincialis]|uniref:B box-type domain-containing protein n=1 Tax=Mytilus galloprovincialis TaxID=29158 RepID=A0A8B6BXZ1_MYTGA|nr:Hypothetical predicted protein [Mytilus galloprovincialis]